MVRAALRDVTKTYGDVVAVDHLDLEFGPDEIVALLGPSGCGKSTVLRVLAGLESPTSGRVEIDGRDVTDLAPRDRGLGLVTQGDTLHDWRTGRGNARFALAVRSDHRTPHVSADDAWIEAQARELRVAHLLERHPTQMSDGERRGVALLRAVVTSPELLLLDEPLVFLDSSLRAELRRDLVTLVRRRLMTAVMVTSDQEDAMICADRIGVLVDGSLHQLGDPQRLYRAPATAAVAAFVGEPAMNLTEAVVRMNGPDRFVVVHGQRVPALGHRLEGYVHQPVLVGIRPEHVAIAPDHGPTTTSRVVTVEPRGHRTDFEVRTQADTVVRVSAPIRPPPIGSSLEVGIRTEHLHWFDYETGMAIHHPVAV